MEVQLKSVLWLDSISSEDYSFCINAPHYKERLKDVEDKKRNTEKMEKIKCDSLKTMMFSESSSAQDICKEFTLLHESISEYSAKIYTQGKIFSPGDCDFLNYWLNNKLSKSINVGDKIDVRGFYNEIKNNNQEIFSGYEYLENDMKNIDPEILKNMELLYDLYNYQQRILDLLLNQVSSEEDNNQCSFYTDKCYEKYITAINRCYGIYDEFYKALKDFKSTYDIVIKQGTEDKYNCKGSDNFQLPEFDAVLQREKTKIMLIQGSSSFLMLILTFPLIYKFTPFGPFLQGKIKKVKNMWKSPKKNKEKLLSSMDIGNNISDNEKYKLAYNSVSNE
ncbi:PIR protein [Plasmodium vivax]|uniref:VIR protein n=1 Tax=Plasmodium vivax TaxID=5855 RepID=A0A565A4W4_PLAVI|nr:PIR protein [Plasmodium vivax]